MGRLALFIAAFGVVSQASSKPHSKHIAAHDKTMSTLITWPEMPHTWDAKTKAAPEHPADTAFETVKAQNAKWVPTNPLERDGMNFADDLTAALTAQEDSSKDTRGVEDPVLSQQERASALLGVGPGPAMM